MDTSRKGDWAARLGRSSMRAMKLAMALDLLAMAPDAGAVADPMQVETNSRETAGATC
jgi:hypothetical protein